MKWLEALTTDPRFWPFYIGGTTGQIGPSIHGRDCREFFKFTIEESWKWIYSCREKESGHRAGIRVLSNHDVTLFIDLTEEIDFVLRSELAGHTEFIMANIGGHWRLPGLRWKEAIEISRFVHPALSKKPADWRTALALLLPAVWICNPEERKDAGGILPEVFRETGIARSDGAHKLAEAWIASVDASNKYAWICDEGGWKTNASWSSRSHNRDDRTHLNHLLELVSTPNKTTAGPGN